MICLWPPLQPISLGPRWSLFSVLWNSHQRQNLRTHRGQASRFCEAAACQFQVLLPGASGYGWWPSSDLPIFPRLLVGCCLPHLSSSPQTPDGFHLLPLSFFGWTQKVQPAGADPGVVTEFGAAKAVGQRVGLQSWTSAFCKYSLGHAALHEKSSYQLNWLYSSGDILLNSETRVEFLRLLGLPLASLTTETEKLMWKLALCCSEALEERTLSTTKHGLLSSGLRHDLQSF